MKQNLGEILTAYCTECRGLCCTEAKPHLYSLSDEFITLAGGLISDPGFRNVLTERLEKEVTGESLYKETDLVIRRHAIRRFLDWIQSCRFSIDAIAGLVAVIKEMFESPNVMDGRDYCGFDSSTGCLISEYRERVCKKYICHQSPSDIFYSIPQELMTYKNFVPLITHKADPGIILNIIKVDLARGAPFRHTKAIFKGTVLADEITRLAGSMGRKAVIHDLEDMVEYEKHKDSVIIYLDKSTDEINLEALEVKCSAYLPNGEGDYLQIVLFDLDDNRIPEKKLEVESTFSICRMYLMEVVSV